uniref:Gamma-glutamyltransferase 7-like n=1 Tax=Sinocyclocheilus anshuiensis TaxID=1608454 RepID=A0A671KHD6_9TELE
MYTPAADTGVTVVEKDAALSTAYSPVDYMSITSFPRLPEDDVSADNTLKSCRDDDKFLSEQDTDPDLFLKSARLQRLPSSASASRDVSPLRETSRDPLAQDCACTRDGLTVIITACLTFATGVTVALIMQIYFGDPQVYNQAAVVTDVARCTSLGFDVLGKQGSSVDAAIAASLCLGIIHPHTSGIGGGGVMLVHDIRRNESRVVDFRETAPSGIHQDMMLHSGLLVAVPGLISGLHQAHQLYGSDFCVQAKGGVLTEDDFKNYTSVIQKPLQSLYQGYQVFVPPPPHAGAALLSALNILEGFNITNQVSRSNIYHWIAESLKIALSQASGLGDSMFDSSVSELVTQMLSKGQAAALWQKISDSQASAAEHYTPSYELQEGAVASQLMIMGTDDLIVSVMSSLNRPFGSRIVTPSGILLNSQMLDFSWPNKTHSAAAYNQRNSIEPGKRPASFLMPIAVRPSIGLCGTYVALGSSNGERALSGITQVLINVLSSRNNMSDSVSYGRLHPLIQNNTLLVDCKFSIMYCSFLWGSFKSFL